MSSEPSAFEPTARLTPPAAEPQSEPLTGGGNNGPLDTGVRLGEFEIERVLGVGGFGIVYQAMDHSLERRVAIKEYMPTSLATRGPDGTVTPMAQSMATTFTLGRESFVNEAKLLARFDHPSLVKVLRFWEERGTAYMAMPFYEGRTLAQTRSSMTEVPTQAWLDALVHPLLGAIETLHEQRVFHRDIAPDNILILGDGRPVLLDLGAARRVISDRTQTLTTILKPKFAPIEQYGQSPELLQGPWTDLYALGAVLYLCITGTAPQEAAVRAVQENYAKLSDPRARLALPGVERLDRRFLSTIDWALSLHPKNRPQTVAAFREALSKGAPADAHKPAVVVPSDEVALKVSKGQPRRSRGDTRPSAAKPARVTRRLWPWLAVPVVAVAALGAMHKHRSAGLSSAGSPKAVAASASTPSAVNAAGAATSALAASTPAIVGSINVTPDAPTSAVARTAVAASAVGTAPADVTSAPAAQAPIVQPSTTTVVHHKPHHAHGLAAAKPLTPQPVKGGGDTPNNASIVAPATASVSPSTDTSAASPQAQGSDSGPANLLALRQMCVNQGAARIFACMDRYCNQVQNASNRVCKKLRQREFNAGL